MEKGRWTCPVAGCREDRPHLHCRSCPNPVAPDKEYCSPPCAIHGGATKRRVGEQLGWFYFTAENGELYRKRLWEDKTRLNNPICVRRPPRGL